MKPIDPKKPVSTVIDGVRYSAHPPVGETEVAVLDALNGPKGELEAVHKVAKAELDKALKGKRKISNVDYDKRLKARIMTRLQAEYSDARRASERYNAILDAVLIGWESVDPSDTGLPEFPKSGPSGFLNFEIKTTLYEWYFGLFGLEKADAKN